MPNYFVFLIFFSQCEVFVLVHSSKSLNICTVRERKEGIENNPAAKWGRPWIWICSWDYNLLVVSRPKKRAAPYSKIFPGNYTKRQKSEEWSSSRKSLPNMQIYSFWICSWDYNYCTALMISSGPFLCMPLWGGRFFLKTQNHEQPIKIIAICQPRIANSQPLTAGFPQFLQYPYRSFHNCRSCCLIFSSGGLDCGLNNLVLLTSSGRNSCSTKFPG